MKDEITLADLVTPLSKADLGEGPGGIAFRIRRARALLDLNIHRGDKDKGWIDWDDQQEIHRLMWEAEDLLKKLSPGPGKTPEPPT